MSCTDHIKLGQKLPLVTEIEQSKLTQKYVNL